MINCDEEVNAVQNKKSWYTKWYILLILTIILLVTFIVAIPLVINSCYLNNDGYITVWNGADTLQFYGTILSFISTTMLGILALWQNYSLSKQNDNYRKMIESKDLPIFQVRLAGFSGFMSKPSVEIINLTQNIATNFEVIKCGIKHSLEAKYFMEYIIKEPYQRYFKENEQIKLEFSGDTPNISNGNNGELLFELKFQYIDIYGGKHNKKAYTYVAKEDLYKKPMIVEEF